MNDEKPEPVSMTELEVARAMIEELKSENAMLKKANFEMGDFREKTIASLSGLQDKYSNAIRKCEILQAKLDQANLTIDCFINR